MAKSRNAKRRDLAKLDDQLGPDHSKVIYQFDDGWTIRRPADAIDRLREGTLMRHCLKDRELAEKLRPSPGEPKLHSLRDPDNYPHATFAFLVPDNPGELAAFSEASGANNQLPLKPEYATRIHQWLASRPYTVACGCEDGAPFVCPKFIEALADMPARDYTTCLCLGL